jgi:hypothetical protein
VKTLARRAFLFAMIFGLTVSGCSQDNRGLSATLNQSASLSGELPANPLKWKVITSGVSTTDSTMFTLYGNDIAVQCARTDSQHNYPNGSAISLVTWTQQEDGRWFGAKIPNQVKSVEFVSVGAATDGRPSYSYQKFEGTPLKRTSVQDERAQADRAAELLSRRAAMMP